MAHPRQSRHDSGFGFKVKVLKTFYCVPPLLGGGRGPFAVWWGTGYRKNSPRKGRESFVDNLLVRVHFIIVMIR